MANIPVEIRWGDAAEQQRALEAVRDAAGQVGRQLDGLLEAEIDTEALPVLRARHLCFSFPKGAAPPSFAGLTADEPLATAEVTPEIAATLDHFFRKTQLLGMTRAKDAFLLRKEPRKRRNVEIDGPGFESSSARPRSFASPATAVPLPEDAYRVKLVGPLEPAWRAELENIAALGDDHPPDQFRMVLTPEQLERVQALPFVQLIRRYGVLDTLSQGMLSLLHRGDDGTEARQFDLTVHVPAGLLKVAKLLEKTAGVRVVNQGSASLRFETTLDSPVLAAIAQLPAVRSLSPYEPPELFLDQARALLGVDVLTPAATGPWDGAGETAALFDSGIDPTHPDLIAALVGGAQAVPDAVPVDANGHGTHVSGIIAGRGTASDGRVRGVAPGAALVSFSIVAAQGQLLIPVDLGDLLQLAVTAGAKVINLSWGKMLRFEYDVYGESIDRFLRANPEVLVVVAAGNEGRAHNIQGAGLGFHQPRTIGMPAAAKNVLTVGACCNHRPDYTKTWGQLKAAEFANPPAKDEPVAAAAPFPAAISSRGPTGFDSIKPDLLAPGTMVLSAKAAATTVGFVAHPLPAGLNGPARYGYLNGTSMAAPMVAGSALLLRQFMRDQRNTLRPSAALLKTLLILAARRIPQANAHSLLRDDAVGFPDFDQGFGALDLSNLLPHVGAPADRKFSFHDVPNDDAKALEARVEAGSSRRSFRTYKVEVVAESNTPLRVALGWTDLAGRGVQNLLSLEVRLGDEKPVPGNHERRMFIDDFAVALGATPFDKKNTVQLVTFAPPVQAGSYRITVRAESTTQPPQGYALAACGPLFAETLPPLF